MTSATHAEVERALRTHRSPEKAAFFPKFFRTGVGGYAEGDQFLGVTVPQQRKVAREFSELSLDEIERLLASPWHECRLTALMILVKRFERADSATREEIVGFYLGNLGRVNNWDLVDTSAPKILGAYLLEHPRRRSLINKLARSGNLWEQRVAVLATFPLTRAGEFEPLLQVAERLLDHPHDLIHKATGWMLRELGKKDLERLRRFLAAHAAKMPRTMLRYAIEKMSPAERKRWLAATASAA